MRQKAVNQDRLAQFFSVNGKAFHKAIRNYLITLAPPKRLDRALTIPERRTACQFCTNRHTWQLVRDWTLIPLCCHLIRFGSWTNERWCIRLFIYHLLICLKPRCPRASQPSSTTKKEKPSNDEKQASTESSDSAAYNLAGTEVPRCVRRRR